MTENHQGGGLSWDDLLSLRDRLVQGGQIPRVEELFARCGQDLDSDQFRQLLSDEIRIRREAGELVEAAEFLSRFPTRGDVVAAIFDSLPTPGSATNPTEIPRRRADPPSTPSATTPPAQAPRSGGVALPGKLKQFVPGTTFGNYEIEEILGRGGMGVVYKARHRVMERRVALKVVAEKPGVNDVLLQRFRREAKVVARLSHPNIVAAFDADDVDGIPFLALEYVPGPDLSDLVKQSGPLTVKTAVEYVIQIARGLGHAHQQGVVHRDIKPSNLLLDSTTGVVKVLDLGLARVEALLDEASRPTELTSTGAVFGTVDFMAPEQARDSKRADARSDIYSLGCTLYFLLTGRMVYPGENMLSKIRAHREAPLPRLGDTVAGAPETLEASFRKMVAKDPADRFTSTTEVIESLQQTLAVLDGSRKDDSPAAGPGVTVITPAGAARRPRRWWPVALAGAVVSVAASAGAWKTFFSRPVGESPTVVAQVPGDEPSQAAPATSDPPVEDVVVEPQTALEWQWPASFPAPARAPFDASQADAHQQAWAEKLNIAVTVDNSVGMSLTLIPPGEYERGAPGDIFGWNVGAQFDSAVPVSNVRITGPVRFSRHEVTREQFQKFVDATGYKTDAERTGQAYVLQPSGSWVVQAGIDWRRPAERSVEPGEPVTQITWNDAQAFCGWLSEQEGVRYRLPTEAEWEYACRAGSELRFGVADFIDDLQPFVWADELLRQPVEKVALGPHPVGSKRPNAWGLHDMLGNVAELCHDAIEPDFYGRAPLENPATLGWGLCAVRGGSYFDAPAGCNPAVRVAASFPTYPTTGFRVVQELPIPPELQTSLRPQLVPAGSSLGSRATVQNPPALPGLRSWSLELATPRATITSLAWSPTAKQVAVASAGDPVIRIYDEKLSLLKLLAGAHGISGGNIGACLAWSPDGKLLATVDWGDYRANGLRIWEVASGAVVLHRPGLAAWTPSVAWSPDGRSILAGGHAAAILDIESGLSRLLASNYGNRAEWSPDGRRVAIADNDARVSIYNPNTLQLVAGLSAAKAECRPPFAWSPDGSQFVTGSTVANEALLFDGATFEFQKALALPQGVTQFLWSSDANRLVLGGAQTILWDLRENKAAGTIAVGGAIDWLKRDESVLIGRSDGLIEVRSVAGLPLARSQDRGRPRATQSVLRPDGQEIAMARDADLVFLDAESGQLTNKFPGVIKPGMVLSWSPRGDWMGAASDKDLVLLDRQTGQPVATLTGHTAAIIAHNWSPDGSRLATTSHDKSVRVWNAGEGRELGQTTLEESPLDVAWSHSGQSLAVALQRELILLSADGSQIVSRHPLPANFNTGEGAGQHALAWSPDDTLLTSGSYTGLLYLLDVASGKFVPFYRSTASITSRGTMQWSPDGNTLLGQSDYNETWLYDRSTREPRRLGYSLRPQWLPDSRRLVSDGFGSLELWGLDALSGRRLGTAFPALGSADEPLVISADGHVRGSAGGLLYVAQTDRGALLTLTPAQFEKRFGWKNDPARATLLRLSTESKSDSVEPKPPVDDAATFGLLSEEKFRSVDLVRQVPADSRQAVSATALVARPAPLAGLRSWTIETAGHRGWVDTLACSPTGQVIATGGEDGTIRLWDRQCRLRRMLISSFNGVELLEWSLDGRYLASVHARTLRLWEAEPGRLLRTVELPFVPHSLSWAPDAARLAVGFETRWGIVDATTGLLDEINAPGQRLAWAPDGRRIAVGYGLSLSIWNADTLTPVETWNVPPDVTGLGALSWSPDGRWVAGSFGLNFTRIGVWNAGTGQYDGDLDPRSASTTRLHWSRDSQRVCNGYQVWDVTSRRGVAGLPGFDRRSQLTPEGTSAAVLAGSRLTIRDLRTGARLAEGPEGVVGNLLDLSADGKTLALSDGAGFSLVDPESGLGRQELPPSGPWQAIVASPQGDLLAAKTEATLAILFSDGRPAKSLIGHADYISELAWSPDGRFLASAGRDGLLHIWDPAQEPPKPLRTFDHKKLWVCGLAWSPDGRRIASITSGLEPLRVWNVEGDQLEREFVILSPGAAGLGPGGNLDWTPEGRTLLIGRGALPALAVDATTGTVRELPLRGLRALSSPDGRQTASALSRLDSADKVFPLSPLQSADRQILLDWFPDSKRLLLAGAAAIRVHSTEHHRLLGSLIPGLARGHRMLVGPEGHVRFWPASRGEIVYLAEETDGRQVVYQPGEFADRFGWKNDPSLATLADASREPAPDTAAPIESREADHVAAVAALSLKGKVRIRIGGTERDIATAESLPVDPFEVVGVWLFQQPLVNADLTFLKGLPALRELSLWACPKIADGILESIGEHPELRRLELHGTGVTDAGLTGLSRFPRLEVLQLDGLPLTDQIAPVIGRLRRLAFLQMGSTELGDATVHELAALPALSSLTLTCPKVTDAAGADFARMKSLQGLSLNAPVGAVIVKSLGSLPLLASLSLTSTRPMDDGPPDLGTMAALKTLGLNAACLSADSLQRIGEFPQLASLDLHTTSLSDEGLRALLAIRSLKSLSLHGASKLTFAGFAGCETSAVESLGLNLPALTDAELRMILRSPALKSLALYSGAITGAGFDAAEGSPLEVLRLQGVSLSADHAAQFTKLAQLRTLTADEPILSAIASGLERLPQLVNLECQLPRSLAAFDRLTQVKSLYVYNAVELPAAEYRHLQGMQGLERVQVFNANFTPECFAALAGIPGKRLLILQAGQTTRAALDQFQTQAPHWTVVLEGCEVKAPE